MRLQHNRLCLFSRDFCCLLQGSTARFNREVLISCFVSLERASVSSILHFAANRVIRCFTVLLLIIVGLSIRLVIGGHFSALFHSIIDLSVRVVIHRELVGNFSTDQDTGCLIILTFTGKVWNIIGR